MVGSGVAVFAVWDYMTTKARDGYVEVNPELLAFTLGGRDQDPADIESALEFLQRPDPKSRSQKEGGRRIVKEGQFQYRLVNWEDYNKIRTEADRREYNRRKQAEHRARDAAQFRTKSKPQRGELRAVKLENNGDREGAEAVAEEGIGSPVVSVSPPTFGDPPAKGGLPSTAIVPCGT
jgi:hypothetical protein